MKALFAGDVCAKADNIKELFKNKDVETLFTNVPTIFKGNDINFINLECALTDSENAIEKFGPNLKSPKETAEVLKGMGVTLCGVSNNHIFDFGKEGWRDTERALRDAGLDFTGFGENYEDSRKSYVYEKDGESVCIIAVCEHEYTYALEDRMGARPFDCYDTLSDVREAKAKHDRVIVIYHGGKEHCPYPSPRILKTYRALAESGADVVLGQHSHCICAYEEYKGSHLFYGQGNFHFIWDGYGIPWNTSLAVKYDTKTNELEFIPVMVKGNGITLAEGEDKEEIFARLEKFSASLKDGSWKDGWHDFAVSMKDKYTSVLKYAYTDSEESEWNTRVFGHYLDCEAHTDVWRELNKTANETNER